jgi:hypothetical protein
MVLTGGALAAATLPVVGLRTWFDWLTVGREASQLYNYNRNWINLSRDLHGIPRRILLDFNRPEAERDTPLTRALAWTLWGTVFATTAVVSLRWGDRKRETGIGAAFLVFGAYQTCYRFMYYDALLSAVGFAVLLAEPARFLRTRVFGLSFAPQSPPLTGDRVLAAPAVDTNPLGPRLVGYVSSFPLTILALLLLVENSLAGMKLEATFGIVYYARTVTSSDSSTSAVTPHLVADTGPDYPWETFLILAVWAWCGWRLIRGDDRNAASRTVR